MPAEPLAHDLKALSAALAEARSQAEAGAPLDLAGLEARAAALCEAVLALPGERATALSPLLEEVASGLAPLADALQAQHAAFTAAAEGRPDPHTARQRAAAVYGRSRSQNAADPQGDPKPPVPSSEDPA